MQDDTLDPFLFDTDEITVGKPYIIWTIQMSPADIWRQVWDQGFIVNLNKLCVGQIFEDVELFLKSEFIDRNVYPKHWLYIFTETYQLFKHNETQQRQ